MPPYTQHSNNNIGEPSMKIDHVTYDAAHKIRSRRPSTTAEKIRNFFSLKSNKNDHVLVKKVRFDLSNMDSEKLTRTTTHPPNIAQVLAQEEAVWKQQQQEQRTLKQSMKPPSKTSHRVTPCPTPHGTLGDTSSENLIRRFQQPTQQPTTTTSNIVSTPRRERETPDLTHVPIYGWRSKKSSTTCEPSYRDHKLPGKITKRNVFLPSKSTSNQTNTTSTSPKYNSGGFSRGRLEHAPNKRLHLQPGQNNPINHRLPKSTSKSKQKEPASVIKSLTTSADLLDAKRRDLQLAFNKHAESTLR